MATFTRYAIAMYIESVPNRNSPPAILLRESYRDGKIVRKRTLLNLSNWAPGHVEGLRGVLKGGVVVPAGLEALTVQRSLPHGHVAAVLGHARAIALLAAAQAGLEIAATCTLAQLAGCCSEPGGRTRCSRRRRLRAFGS